MKRQEMFDDVWDHFVVQENGPSIDDGVCRYWNRETGAKCAIGCLIPEDKYVSKIESLSVMELWHRWENVHLHGESKHGSAAGWEYLMKVLGTSGLNSSKQEMLAEFLFDLQQAHDDWAYDIDPMRQTNADYDVRDRLENVAYKWELSIPENSGSVGQATE